MVTSTLFPLTQIVIHGSAQHVQNDYLSLRQKSCPKVPLTWEKCSLVTESFIEFIWPVCFWSVWHESVLKTAVFTPALLKTVTTGEVWNLAKLSISNTAPRDSSTDGKQLYLSSTYCVSAMLTSSVSLWGSNHTSNKKDSNVWRTRFHQQSLQLQGKMSKMEVKCKMCFSRETWHCVIFFNWSWNLRADKASNPQLWLQGKWDDLMLSWMRSMFRITFSHFKVASDFCPP